MTKLNDWTYNVLTISTLSGDSSEQSELKNLIYELEDWDDQSPLTFYSHCEIPKCLVDNYEMMGSSIEDKNIRECGYPYLHAFTQKEWGCVTDAHGVEIFDSGPDYIVYEFRTRSTAPLSWVKQVSKCCPSLLFEIECINEMDLWPEFSSVYINGELVTHEFAQKQKE
jgi:hypothetical protein